MALLIDVQSKSNSLTRADEGRSNEHSRSTVEDPPSIDRPAVEATSKKESDV